MQKVYSKLCPALIGHILRWIDGDQFIASIIGKDGKQTEMICHRQYWRLEDYEESA